MAARVCDLEILDVDGLAYFQFRWEGSKVDWWIALELIKANIDGSGREYDGETKLWRASCAYEDELARIFPNFAGTLDAIRSQMSLFGDGNQ